MNSFYRVIDKIKQAVSSEPFNNQVTFGDIADVDPDYVRSFAH